MQHFGDATRAVQVLQAEVAGQQVQTESILADLAQLASEADTYAVKRNYLEAVRSCKIIPLKTRENLPVRFHPLVKSSCCYE
jgi:hypothetical protein